jgi:NAD(P)-dependent dehydrogenase (short-subunit alcohol dehydrogenase family)
MADQSGRALSGKAAFVTGGAKRLGKAAALALAEAGADVTITFLRSEKEAQQTARQIEKAGVRALTVPCDVTNPASVRSAVSASVRHFKRLDILVNNAGRYETVDFDKLSIQQWDTIFNTNVRGPFLVSRAALPHLRKQKGKIINLGSLGGLRAWPTHAHYCSSKAALHMLTKAMAKALAPEIAVNCVAPGMIDLGEKAAASFMRRMSKQTPMLRNGDADDVAAAIMFFAAAPHFITGQILSVDGGLGL